MWFQIFLTATILFSVLMVILFCVTNGDELYMLILGIYWIAIFVVGLIGAIWGWW